MLTGRIIYSVTCTIFVLLLFGCKEVTQKQSTIDSSSQVSENTVIKTDSLKPEIQKDSIITEQNRTNKETNNSVANKKVKKDSTLSKKEDNQKILAYYFHPAARCVTCRNIEAYSLEAINEWEKKNGRKIIWQELNIEDSVNEHYVSEYNLEFSSLVIARYTEGRKDKWKNLEDTWKLVNDKESFKKYVTFELNQFVKNN